MTNTLQADPLAFRTDPHPAGVPRRLRAAHRAASDCIGGLDLGDRALWRSVSPLVAQIARAAYELSAAARGEIPTQTAAADVPPVVRARELASAQSGLFAALEQGPSLSPGVMEASAAQVERLVRLVAEYARTSA